jgi:hypothetical protein
MIGQTEAKNLIQAAAGIILEAVFNLLQEDPHQWSTRPCSTCRAISAITQRDFGCVLYRKEKEGKQ